jgi:hypothetical protein
MKAVFRRNRPKQRELPTETVQLPYDIVYAILSNMSLHDLWSARVINRLFHQTSLELIYKKFIKSSSIIMILPRLSHTWSHAKPIEFKPIYTSTSSLKMLKWSSTVTRTEMIEIVFHHDLHPGSPSLINRLQFKLDDRHVVNHHFRAAFEYENGKVSWFRGNNSQHKLYDARLSRECKGAFRILFTRAINLRRGTEWEGYFTWNGGICEVHLPIWDIIKIVEFSRNRRMCN